MFIDRGVFSLENRASTFKLETTSNWHGARRKPEPSRNAGQEPPRDGFKAKDQDQ
jgi:hypothetical protein